MADKELLLQEAAEALDIPAAKVYQMGVRGELDLRYDERFKKWLVTSASVEKMKKVSARGA